jgi:erythromycin esterase-like protein
MHPRLPRFVLSLLPIVLASHTHRALAQPATAVEMEPGRAIRESIVLLRTVDPGTPLDDLEPLRALIGDARIVSLGEPTHGSREAFQMKHRLLRFLVEEMGFSIFSIEANMPEAYALNDYVISGIGDPRELVRGMYFWTWQTEEVLAMVEWMRAWNLANPPSGGKPRLQFTGFDMQTPHVAWKIADDFIHAHAPDLSPTSEPLLRALGDVMAAARGQAQVTDWAAATAEFPVAAARGKSVTLSCWIRTKGVTNFADLWWRTDTPAGNDAPVGLRERAIAGDTDWTRYEFTTTVPVDATNAAFGFSLAGAGAVWFDDVQISIDGVRYEDPNAFSLDFENDAVKFLSWNSRAYLLSRTTNGPHAGAKCLELRRRPEAELGAVDPTRVLRDAQSLLTALENREEALAAKAGEQPTQWAIQNARIVAQSARMHANIADGFNIRDESMASNVRWILQHNPGERIVLWAHNGHASRAGYMEMRSMGSFLDQTFGKWMVVIGFATGRGTYTAASAETGALVTDNQLAPPPSDSVERVLSDAGVPIAIVDLRGSDASDPGSSWAATARPMRSIGALATDQQFFPCVPRDMFDLLIWIEETSASVPLTSR